MTEAQLLDDAEANLASIETYMDSQFALIDAEGMEMMAYEGGGHMDGSDSVSIDANDDPRMEEMIVSLFSMWKAAGGKDSAMSFLVRDFANWGALRYPTQPLGEAPKYRGLMRAIGDQ